LARTISPKAKKWLVGTHLLFASVWVGAVVALFLLSLKSFWVDHTAVLKSLHSDLLTIEYILVIPPAFGSLITGGLLSLWTNWGFFKYRWVLFKWIATVSLIIFGAVFLNTWIEGMFRVVVEQGVNGRLHNPYKLYAQLNLIFVPIQWLVLVFMLFLSVLKPWGKRGQTKK
jgi:hypothetical protein